MSFHFSSFSPASHLSVVVKNFFTLEVEEDTLHTDYLFPDGLPSFFYIQTQEPAQTHFGKRMFPLQNGFYTGYSNREVKLTHRQLKIVGASIYPVYFHIIFDKSPLDIMNSFQPLGDISELESVKKLVMERRYESIVKNFESYIDSRVNKHPLTSDIEIIHQRIMQDKSALSIEGLASSLGYSTRHLNSRFKQFFGMSPKKFIRLIRFNEALKHIYSQKEGERNLSSIAQEMGYHDHSHFIKDFKAICGKTPKEIFSSNGSLADKFQMF